MEIEPHCCVVMRTVYLNMLLVISVAMEYFCSAMQYALRNGGKFS